jgi:soluble lytic murein transglycosylase-like protein
MVARITVSTARETGVTVPAAHCRHAAGGCEKRLSEFARYLVEAGQRHAVDPWVMAAMAFRESGYNPFAMGSLGELGILQIHPKGRRVENVRFMRDEWYRRRCRQEVGACQREIVDHAAQVLSRSLTMCGGSLNDALGAYNTGRCGGNDRYSKRILKERVLMLESVGLPAKHPEPSPS